MFHPADVQQGGASHRLVPSYGYTDIVANTGPLGFIRLSYPVEVVDVRSIDKVARVSDPSILQPVDVDRCRRKLQLVGCPWQSENSC